MPMWEKLCSPIAERVSSGLARGPAGAGPRAGRPAAGHDGLDGRHGVRLVSSARAWPSSPSRCSPPPTSGCRSAPDGTAALLPLLDRRVRRRVSTSPRTRSASTWPRARPPTTGCTPACRGCAKRVMHLIANLRRSHHRRLLGRRGPGRRRWTCPTRRASKPRSGRACSSRRSRPASRRTLAGTGDAAGAGRGLGGHRRRRCRRRSAARAPLHCRRRCAADGPPAVRPSRPSPR